jgi:hypothetical protein
MPRKAPSGPRAASGAGRICQRLEEAELLSPEPREDLLALDEALTQLAADDRTAAALVQLRYFGGLSIPAAALVLGIPPARLTATGPTPAPGSTRSSWAPDGKIRPEIPGVISPGITHYIRGAVPPGACPG